MRLEKLTIEALVRRFEEITLQQAKALREDDNRAYNALIDPMREIRTELKSRPGDLRASLLPLLEHSNTQVRLMAAFAVLKVAPEAARKALQLIADTNDFPQAADARGRLSAIDEGRFVPE
jgi:hypothetical protein